MTGYAPRGGAQSVSVGEAKRDLMYTRENRETIIRREFEREETH